ncbi:hypothetical protein PPACK8108_LOCUS6596 [Phakopsora pachyrhizi]|uniref:Uncharacterized protein n=1 Tax=Phakopsora pachyrhizi TaxID=170000 RepID=A0AAV0AUU8_PHAPC|nr:hypothetical protein PPACK8108_LOCUS6596 [Phakopsora pachyrhizi]
MSCTQLMMFIAHFVLKDDLIKECRSDLTGARAETLSGSITSIDAAQAVSLCEQDWQRGTWWDLGWFVLISTLAFLFTGLVGAYYQQLLDPTLSQPIDPELAQQNISNSNSNNLYPLQSYGSDHMSSHLLSQEPPFAPPQYSHPPEYPTRYEGENRASAINKKDGLTNVKISSAGPS